MRKDEAVSEGSCPQPFWSKTSYHPSKWWLDCTGRCRASHCWGTRGVGDRPKPLFKCGGCRRKAGGRARRGNGQRPAHAWSGERRGVHDCESYRHGFKKTTKQADEECDIRCLANSTNRSLLQRIVRPCPLSARSCRLPPRHGRLTCAPSRLVWGARRCMDPPPPATRSAPWSRRRSVAAESGTTPARRPWKRRRHTTSHRTAR